ncbi:hypothetical protein FOZ61_008613 [Perkinsus olseni]|uniref:HEAT repeat domain-containing protein n=1 Tax=Perkinsus olseni TaxID=32597 RepID=A0A7J6M6H2_PEROL|nr:hypothetical protein FOZ61_008613 [Perkinsus olseni]
MVGSPLSSSASRSPSSAAAEPDSFPRDRLKALRLLKQEALRLLHDQNDAYRTGTPFLSVCTSQLVADIVAKPEQWPLEVEALVRALAGCTPDSDSPILDFSAHLFFLSHCPLRLRLIHTAMGSASAKLELAALLRKDQYRRACWGITAALEVLQEDPRKLWEIPDNTLEDLHELLRSSKTPECTPSPDDGLSSDEGWAEALAVVVEMVSSVSQRMLTSAEDFGGFFVDDWARSRLNAIMANYRRHCPDGAASLSSFLRQWLATDQRLRAKLLDDLASRLIISLRGTETANVIIRSLIEDPQSDAEFNLITRLEGPRNILSPETLEAIVRTCPSAQWRRQAWQSCDVLSEDVEGLCRKSALYDPDAQVRLAALRCLGRIDKAAAAEALRDADGDVRQAALDIAGLGALASCSTPHLIVLALSRGNEEMFAHVEAEILKRLKADVTQLLRDLRVLERKGEDTVLHILKDLSPVLSSELPNTSLGLSPLEGKRHEPPPARKRKVPCAWRPWEGVSEQATPMRSLRLAEPIEDSDTPRECSEQISSCGSSARAIAAACEDLSEADLNALAWKGFAWVPGGW